MSARGSVAPSSVYRGLPHRSLGPECSVLGREKWLIHNLHHWPSSTYKLAQYMDMDNDRSVIVINSVIDLVNSLQVFEWQESQ